MYFTSYPLGIQYYWKNKKSVLNENFLLSSCSILLQYENFLLSSNWILLQ